MNRIAVKEEVNLGRRVFLCGAGCGAGRRGCCGRCGRPHVIAAAAKTEPGEVTIVQFSDDGKRLAKVKIAKVVKTEEEWRKQLPSGVFEITRHADTEIAYSGKLLESCTTRGFSAASAATMRCSVRRRSLIRERAGRAFGSRLRRKMCGRFATAASAWSGRRFRARNAMRTWGTCLTMVRSRRGCGIA